MLIRRIRPSRPRPISTVTLSPPGPWLVWVRPDCDTTVRSALWRSSPTARFWRHRAGMVASACGTWKAGRSGGFKSVPCGAASRYPRTAGGSRWLPKTALSFSSIPTRARNGSAPRRTRKRYGRSPSPPTEKPLHRAATRGPFVSGTPTRAKRSAHSKATPGGCAALPSPVTASAWRQPVGMRRCGCGTPRAERNSIPSGPFIR